MKHDLENVRVAFVTNMCTHYVTRLFEELSRGHRVDFYFTGGYEAYWDKKNRARLGDFRGEYLKGFILTPRLKITPGLFSLARKRYGLFIKTIEDRFALPVTFFMAKILRVPFILWTQQWAHPDTLFHKISFVLIKFIYRHADAIVVYGDHVHRYLLGLGVQDRKIFCAPQSLDNSAFNRPVSQDEKKSLKNKMGLVGQRIVLFVGRLEECKGVFYLVEAAAKFKDRNACLVFVGTGELKTDLAQRCEALGVRFRFLDHVPNDELYLYYAAADVFVLPSITTRVFKEPWGAVVNEAMNQGCPVVATDAVGAAVGGLVAHGETGYVVPEKNSAALAEAIIRLLEDEALRTRMGVRAKERVAGWTPQRTAEGFSRAIRFALNGVRDENEEWICKETSV